MLVHTSSLLSTPYSAIQRIFTSENMYDQAECEEVENFAPTYIWPAPRTKMVIMTSFEIRDDDRAERSGMQNVVLLTLFNHTTKVIYWLQKYDTCKMITE